MRTRALREYWKPEVGQAAKVEATFTMGKEKDYQLILGLHHKADVSVSDIAVREAKKAANRECPAKSDRF